MPRHFHFDIPDSRTAVYHRFATDLRPGTNTSHKSANWVAGHTHAHNRFDMRTKIDRRPALVTLAGALMLLCAVWIDDVAAAAAAAVRQPASSSVEALGQPNDSAVDEMAAAHDGGSDEGTYVTNCTRNLTQVRPQKSN